MFFIAIPAHNSAQYFIRLNFDRAKEFTFRMSAPGYPPLPECRRLDQQYDRLQILGETWWQISFILYEQGDLVWSGLKPYC